MQQVDDPPSLPVGTEVSAKYKGAFCEAKVSKVVRNIKVKVAYKQGLGSGIVSDDAIKAPTGQLRVGAVVEVRHPDRKENVEATIAKIQDCSQYTVVFDDGDITTLRRTALCLKSGRHFNESETLDQLPLTHPEHFGNPVVGGRRGRRRGQLNEDSSDDDDESDAKEVVNEKEENIGKVVCVETESKKKDKEKWFPALVVAPTAQATVRIRVKDEYLVRSFKDGRYYTVPKKEATEFTREVASKQDVPAVQAALEFLGSSILPPHWDRDSLFGLSNLSSDDEGEIDSDSSDDEPHEEKDRFVAQLYKYMDDRGTPLNKVPSIQSRDVDLYRLFSAVQKRGGYNRVTTQNQWKMIAVRLGFTPCTLSVMNLVKQAYKKFLQPYFDFHRKLGCSMLNSRNSNRSKGRSLVRANSVASPKPAETSKTETISKLAMPNQPSSNVVSSTSAAATAANISATSALAASSATAAASTNVTAVTTTAAAPTASNVAATSAAAAISSAAEESENTSESSLVEPAKKQRKASAVGSGKVKSLVEKYEATSAAAASVAAIAAAAEADVPLAKIKAAAATRNSVDKEPTTTTSNASSKAASETQRSRDVSPAAAPPSSAKKEKHQRKQVDKSDEKQRGKRKKDEITVEKIDTGDFIVGIGDKLKVNYHEKKSPSSHGSTYEAKVIEISVQRGVPMYLVHYTGWNNRYDEWVPRERIAENLTKGSKQKTRTTSTGSGNSGGPGQTPNSGTAAVSTAAGGIPGGGSNTSVITGGPGVDKQAKEAAGGATASKSIAGAGPSQQAGIGTASSASTTGGPNAANAVSVLQSVSKTPTTGAKRGRGRSDSMPPRSTTPSSVASNSSRTKSPAASQLKKRPTRKALSSTVRRTSANVSDDASMATESDSDSDEPVRRPKRQHIKDAAAFKAGKAQQPAGKARLTAAAVTASRQNSASESEDDDDDSAPPPRAEPPSLQRPRAGPGVRTMSNSAKGRDYDLSEIRNELKGFQPQLLGNLVSEERKDATASTKHENTPTIADHTGIDSKKECSKTHSANKSESAKSSSTELSSETESFNDDDSQSSDKAPLLELETTSYEKKKQMHPSDKPAKQHLSQDIKPTTTCIVEQIKNEPLLEKPSVKTIKEEGGVIRKETELTTRSVITAATIPAAVSEERKPLKTELKDEEPAKPKAVFHSSSDIKPTTLIAPARFSGSSAAAIDGGSCSGAKYTSVIVEKPLGLSKKSCEPVAASAKKPELHKKQSLVSTTSTALASGTAQAESVASKKFAEPVLHKETATLKVELPAACSPSSSSSSSSSFCSTASAGTTISASSVCTSSSATRSLPDLSKLEIGGSVTATAASTIATSATAAPLAVPAAKESKYSSSAGVAAATNAGGKLLFPDVYEFKDTEPFEFEKRISPMASVASVSCGTSVITATTAATHTAPVQSTTMLANPAVVLPLVSATARKLALKTSAMQQCLDLPYFHGPSKVKKRGSPMKEATLLADKAKMQKLEETKQPPSATSVTVAAAVPATAAPAPKQAAAAAVPAAVQQKVITSTAPLATPLHLAAAYATPFDVLRRSPSFNLNITALNEELAQTVQETTRALTDALQPPTAPLLMPAAAKPVEASMGKQPEVLPIAAADAAACISSLAIKPVPRTPPPAQASATGPSIAANSPKLSTPPQVAAAAAKAHIVGSPFIETRNVFELSTSNEGSGYSSGESKDNKLEKLECVKILLGGTACSYLDTVQFEQKPTSIADKVLKAISQKKEEVENSKAKAPETDAVKSEEDSKPETSSSAMSAAKLEPLNALVTAKLLSEPLKIQTGPLPTAAHGMLGELYRSGSSVTAQSSPETKSLLESLPVKNSELSETIQKLESAIQRKTPVGGLSLSSSTPPTHTPNSLANVGAGYSDDSMDSTDSEQRLVIEDELTEEQTNTNMGEQKSPQSETSSSLSAPVKLASATGAGTIGLQVPIPLKLGAPSFTGKLNAAIAAQSQLPPLVKLPAEEAATSSLVPIVLPEIPVSVVVAPGLVNAALLHSPSQAGSLPSPGTGVAPLVCLLPQPECDTNLLLKSYAASAQTQLATVSPSVQVATQLSNSSSSCSSSAHTASVSTAASGILSSYAMENGRMLLLADEQLKGSPTLTVATARVAMPPIADSPQMSEPPLNESINLLCEETIPGSPAPTYSKDEPAVASAATALGAASTVLAMAGVTPLPPDTPPAMAVSAPAGAAVPSAPNSSPDSGSQDDNESSEETNSNLSKKQVENETGNVSGSAQKRKRTRKQAELAVQPPTTESSGSKRRRQGAGGSLRKTTNTTAGSDTDDNSDIVLPAARQSARQQMLPQSQQQQVPQQLPQPSANVNSSGVRTCPYNFLVELDSSLSSEQCISILRKQIQDLRKVYNTIKGDLAVIDRRRKKLRRREREKKQQLQSQQQGKLCT